MIDKKNVQDKFLKIIQENKLDCNYYLINGIKLQGKLISFDQYVLVIDDGSEKMVYKNALSTLAPVNIDSEISQEFRKIK